MLLILFVMMFGVPLLSLLRRFEIFSYYCDDATRSTWVWLKKTKFETRLFFLISFYKMICTQFHTNMKVIRTNNAQEYFLKYFFYCSWYYSLALLFYNSTTKLSCGEKTPPDSLFPSVSPSIDSQLVPSSSFLATELIPSFTPYGTDLITAIEIVPIADPIPPIAIIPLAIPASFVPNPFPDDVAPASLSTIDSVEPDIISACKEISQDY